VWRGDGGCGAEQGKGQTQADDVFHGVAPGGEDVSTLELEPGDEKTPLRIVIIELVDRLFGLGGLWADQVPGGLCTYPLLR